MGPQNKSRRKRSNRRKSSQSPAPRSQSATSRPNLNSDAQASRTYKRTKANSESQDSSAEVKDQEGIYRDTSVELHLVKETTKGHEGKEDAVRETNKASCKGVFEEAKGSHISDLKKSSADNQVDLVISSEVVFSDQNNFAETELHTNSDSRLGNKSDTAQTMSLAHKMDCLSALLEEMLVGSGKPKQPKTLDGPSKPEISNAFFPKEQKDIGQHNLVKEKVPIRIFKTDTDEQRSSREEKQTLTKADKGAKKGKKHEGKTEQQPGQEKESKTPKAPEKEGSEGPQKSKAELRKERREKQEAQRLAKEQLKMQKEEGQKQQEAQKHQKAATKQTAKVVKQVEVNRTSKQGSQAEPRKIRTVKRLTSFNVPLREKSSRKIPLLAHLPLYNEDKNYMKGMVNSNIHPAIVRVGLQMKTGLVDGSNARCIAMMAAFKKVIKDYSTPEAKELSRDLANQIKPYIVFLQQCRQESISMANAIRFLTRAIATVGSSLPEAQAKEQLRDAIEDYVRVNIEFAGKTIAMHAAQQLEDSDVILTYGFSALVYGVVHQAVIEKRKNISVIVIDSRHPQTGKALVTQLAALGVQTHYRLLSDVTQIMDKVTKVVLEADSVMMNGAVQAACGTAYLAMTARFHDKPVMVLCETYKFSNNVLTDSLVVNELGDPRLVIACPSTEYSEILGGWSDTRNLNVVNLVYDVMPPNLVTALVTEQSILPTTSVPVIIRRQYGDILGQD